MGKNQPNAATHSAALTVIPARSYLVERRLWDASATVEGRAREAERLKLERIGRQIHELIASKYEVAHAAVATNSRAEREQLLRKEREIDAQIIYLADARKELGR